jgi:hypothetical protein
MLLVPPEQIRIAALKKIPQPLEALVKTSLVAVEPEPRSVQLFLFNVMEPLSVNVPGPNSTYWFPPQLEIAVLMVAGLPLYAAMVLPDCVRFVGTPPSTPAFDQSVARVLAMTLDHGWA